MKSVREGECLIAKRDVCFADGLKNKNLAGGGSRVGFRKLVTCDFSRINCSFSLNKFAGSIH